MKYLTLLAVLAASLSSCGSDKGPAYSLSSKRVTVGPRSLDQAVAALNREVDEAKPWGAFGLTADMVKESISSSFYRVPGEYSAQLQKVLAGNLGANEKLEFMAGSSAKGDRRYFFIRLSLENENDPTFGYSLPVGRDAQE